ncbi:MAG: DUF4394 domain-containing protein [Acidobacteria bacterium]|nr:DUF4394 domain-containing protein [Acidobacteriota bacterium]
MKHTTRITWKSLLLVLGLLGLTSTLVQPLPALPGGFNFKLTETVSAFQVLPGPAIEGTIFALTTGGNLISFNPATPGAIIRNVPITGLPVGEVLLGIDFRPATGVLYAVSTASIVYTVNTMTGAVTAAGAPFTPTVIGNSFGIDFNPLPDRIRLVSDGDQNLRLNPNNGAIAGMDTGLAYASGDAGASSNPSVVASAYTNNFGGATTTSLYGIDSERDTLVLQGSLGGAPVSPNTGMLTTVGSLGIDVTDVAGFDITNPGGIAFASLTINGASAFSSLYRINLQTGAATLIGTIGVTDTIRDISAVVRVETIFALTSNNNLLRFNSGTPGTIASTLAITGLGAGEMLVGIDFRPATGQLFAASNQSRVYTLNTATGAATSVGGAAFTPPFTGASFGFDFNPVPDRIRTVSDARQSLRLNPINGAIAGVDGTLAFASSDANASATPNVVGAAYTNNVAGATATSLYVIDSNLDALLLQGSLGGTPISPNTGTLTTVGMLGVNTTDQVGFDIAPATDAAFISLTATGATNSSLYTLNLATGATTLIGAIGGNATIRGIAIAPRIETIFAATNSNKLISFNPSAPGVILSTTTITGLGDETVIGIDFRPANGQLYAIGSSSRIFTVNPLTGVATQVGTGITSPQLNGVAYGFDFNPMPDRIRVVSTATHNLRFVPDTGAPAVAGGDPFLNYADQRIGQPPFIVGAAYDNNVAGTPSTTLYVIDSSFDSLVMQGSPGGTPTSPNTGQLFTIGPLGVDTNEMVGFDIGDQTNNAYASLTVGGVSQLHRINLATGAASLIGNIGGGEVIRGIAIANTAPPSAQPAGLVVVNAASYASDAVAPDSLVAMFGRFQTDDGRSIAASSQPLPTSLGGVTVTVNGTAAQLLFANNGQINFMLPSLISSGMATVVVTNNDGSTDTGTINMVQSATGIFTVSSTGQGTAAALWTNDGITFQPVFNPDGSERDVSPGTAAKPTFLVVYVTGTRNAPAANPNDSNGMAEAVSATIQNIPVTVTWAGPAPDFSGLDQINMLVPTELAGAGTVGIKLTVAGRTSNMATVRIGR